MTCEMCGSSKGLVKASVEGVMLTVCSKCSSFGKVVEERKVPEVVASRTSVEEVVIDEVGTILRTWREGCGLTQKEVAVKVSEKESLIGKIEGGFVPSIKLACKLEKLVGRKLVDSIAVGGSVKKVSSSGGMTIGDMLKQ